MGKTRQTEHLRLTYGPSEGRMVYLWPVKKLYGLFYGP